MYGVPDLYFNGEVFDIDIFGPKFNSEGGFVVRLEPAFCKTEEET